MVVSIWRYPVKSMLGEELNSSYVTERGLIGDRAYALIDQKTGKVASAKNPKKWGKLFDFRSVFIDPPQVVENIPSVRITFPDGTHIFSDQDNIDYTLSKVLDQDVKLMRASLERPSYEQYWPDICDLAQRAKVTDETMPSQTFFDLAVIHLLTTSTINRLRELYPEGRFEVRRFRPNIVIESASGEKDFIENLWMGKKIMIGEDIVLRVTGSCTRRVMTTLPQGDLPKDLGILRTIARYNKVNAGVYASVQRGGTIRRGDLMRFEG
ncbi:MAG: MOSC domain-containing protein [Candidatus Nitrosopolaris wilkensis]|nr:MAG: MOSC domain-containing protein [Candidatus Nitrosopolaris wilkensis]